LKAAKPEELTCKWGPFCGPDGLCTEYGYQGLPDETFGSVCKIYTDESRDLIIKKWEEEHDTW